MSRPNEEPVADAPRPMAVPKAERVQYERNLIRTAVCEFRFPTLLELENRPPEALQKALRKEYPFYEKGVGTTINIPVSVEKENRHLFRSQNRRWSVRFTASAIALESIAYKSYEDFEERFQVVLKASQKLIDADFFTRIGLRYINALPVDQSGLEGWVNPELVRPLVAGIYGDVQQFWQEIHGNAPSGRYVLRHGLADTSQGKKEYILDSDFYAEEVVATDALSTLRKLHLESYDLFAWAMGPEAKKSLGPTTPKTGAHS